MKKIFTLVSIAFCAMSVNAQEVYKAANYVDGNCIMDEAFTNAEVKDGKSIVTVNTANVTMTAVGGTTPKSIEKSAESVLFDEESHYWTNPNVTEWNDVTWGGARQDDIQFGYITGTGNPYTKLYAEEVYTDNEPTDTYRAAYQYYEPDGSVGFPVQGLYYEFKTKVDGTLKVGVWVNKGNRKLFVVDKATGLALTPNVDYTLDGYENGVNDGEGKKAYTVGIPTKAIEGGDLYIWGANKGNQNIWGYLNIPVKAGKEYMIFLHSAQIGFQGFEFTAKGSGISNITAADDADAPVYNLAGQRVSKDTKGLLIKNGKKFINK
ncbi:MAG: hypothetical protein J6C05_06920 [Prevotella sp.]|nr:hypothetical protein [Prevotella sp.]